MLLGNHPCNDGFDRSAGGEPDILVAQYNMLKGANAALLRLPCLKAALFFGGWGSFRPPWPAVSIVADDQQIGAMAARVLVRSGLRDFAFLGAPHGDRWNAARRDAFAAALAKKGFGPVADYSPSAQHPDWRRERRRLVAWVKALPKPSGVFAAFDQRARHLLCVCHDEGIPVPRQLQVVGADDEEYICENEIPSLSSIAIDFRGAAQQAMQAIFAHLEAGAPLPGLVLAGAISKSATRPSSGTPSRTSCGRRG